MVTVLQKRPIHEDILSQTKHRNSRDLGAADAHRTGTLNHVSFFNHATRISVVFVEDAGHLRILVDTCLRGLIRLKTTVPVHVIISNVQHRRSQGRKRIGPVQLKT